MPVRECEVSAGGEHFCFGTYYVYDARYPAVNVKVHTSAEVSAHYKERFDALAQNEQYQLQDRAFSNVQDLWWDLAAERAAQLGFVIEQHGRQGGWLVVKWRVSDLVDDAETAHTCELRNLLHPGSPWNTPTCDLAHEHHRRTTGKDRPFCLNCGLMPREHVRKMCPLVLGAQYTPHPFTHAVLDRLRNLQALLDWCEQQTARPYIQDLLNVEMDELLEGYFSRQDEPDS